MRHTPHLLLFFFSMQPRPPKSTLFPYTTLFRSGTGARRQSRDPRLSMRIGLISDTHGLMRAEALAALDRKSTRLNSSHVEISYAVFCLKKKKKTQIIQLILRTSARQPKRNVEKL